MSLGYFTTMGEMRKGRNLALGALSEKHEKIVTQQLSMFEQEVEEQWLIRTGKRVRIMNWDTNKMEYFDKDLKK